jgi:hypothetical protein
MRRTGLLTLGTVLALLGVLFTLQGVGVIHGSAMSNTTFWSVAGPVIIVLGVGLAALGLRRRGSGVDEQAGTPDGTPVGRRAVLGLIALGTAGVLGGNWLQNRLASLLGPIEERDPTGLISLLPLGETFRLYSVTGPVPVRTAATYRLEVFGLVDRPVRYTLADLQTMRQTDLVRDFQCITGWRVRQVHWSGVPLSALLDRAQPTARATAVRFHSFDGTHTVDRAALSASLSNFSSAASAGLLCRGCTEGCDCRRRIQGLEAPGLEPIRSEAGILNCRATAGWSSASSPRH